MVKWRGLSIIGVKRGLLQLLLQDTYKSKVHSLSSGKVAATPILNIRPIAIFVVYSLNYSLTARLQDNSCAKSLTKVETKRKLQQFTVYGWLIIDGERVVVKKGSFYPEITFHVKCQ